MKHPFRKISIVLTILALSGLPAFAESRTAVIDLKKVFDGYWKTAEAKSTVKDKATEFEKQLKGLADDFQKNRDEYQKLVVSANDSAVSVEERDKRRKAADAKRLQLAEADQTIQSFQRQASTTIEEKFRQMNEKILGEIRAVINSKAKTAGYASVLDSSGVSANGAPVLLYTNGENDITDEVIAQLNTTAPVATSPDKPAAKK